MALSRQKLQGVGVGPEICQNPRGSRGVSDSGRGVDIGS